jgi:two-component system, NarL family, sensor kinase
MVAAGLLVVAAAWVGFRSVAPTDGAPVSIDYGFARGLTVDPVAGDRSPLRPGDVVVAVEGVPLDDVLRGASIPHPGLRGGAEWRYRVLRDGETIDVLVPLRRGGLVVERLRDAGTTVVTNLIILALGAYTVLRRPDHPAARALLLLGAGKTAYDAFGLLLGPVAEFVAARGLFVAGVACTTAFLGLWAVAATHLALSFPVPVAVLRRHPCLVPGCYVLVLLVTVVAPTLYLASGWGTLAGLDRLFVSVNSPVLFALGGLILLGAGRTVLRAVRDRTTRRQGALAAIGMGTTVGLVLIGNLFLGSEWPAWYAVGAWIPLPAALAAALVRGEFLEIRATVNRALVFASLTVVLLGIYAAAVVAVAAVVGRSGLVATLPATGLVAVAFSPVRARLQANMDRLLYGERGDPARALAALGRKLEAALPPDQVLPAIAETVADALRLPYVGIRTTVADTGRLACERGEMPDHPERVPLVHQGRSVGELLVGPRPGERAITESDRVLLADIARQVAFAVSAAGLLTEVAASHDRLAVAREEERARLRHDLHDRLGSHLVGLSLQLDTIEGRALGSAVIDEIRTAHLEAERALGEVRRISRGLRPAELEDLGLVAAVKAAVTRLTVGDEASCWHASVEAAVQLPPVPATTEAAAYHIAVEALTNAYRHSEGNHAEVHIGVIAVGGGLVIEVSDNGVGLNDQSPEGVGLRSMQARVAQVGGHLEISPRPSGGTIVRAEFPLTPGVPK